MIAKNSKKTVGCDYVTTTAAAVKISLKKEGLFGGVNYKTDFFGFFPFSWFAFRRYAKMRKAKQSLTKTEKDKGKENVVERANISERI